jgi:hypothetical protein
MAAAPQLLSCDQIMRYSGSSMIAQDGRTTLSFIGIVAVVVGGAHDYGWI